MEIYHPKDEELLREMRRVRRKAKQKRLTWGLVIWVILCIAAGWFLFNRYYMLTVMQGPQMGDTLPVGSVVLVRRTENRPYKAGDILLYDNTLAMGTSTASEKAEKTEMHLVIKNAEDKVRQLSEYRLYREQAEVRTWLITKNGATEWTQDASAADVFKTDMEGNLTLRIDGLEDGDYFLSEISTSYGRDLMKEPVPITVESLHRTQLKRVLAGPGDSVVLSPYAETRVNGQEIDRTYTSGNTADAAPETRRLTVADGEYFVQGDQLSLSLDSRERNYDTVKAEQVIGKAELVLWPISCIKAVGAFSLFGGGGAP